MAWQYNGSNVRTDIGFKKTDGSTTPRNWFTAWDDTEKANQGLTYVDNDNPIYYKENGDAYTLSELKTTWLDSNDRRANMILAATDWYVTRNSEKSVAIPNAVTTERDRVRTEHAAIETKINNCTTINQFKALFTKADESDPYEQIYNYTDLAKYQGVYQAQHLGV